MKKLAEIRAMNGKQWYQLW